MSWEWSGIYSGAPYENLSAAQWNRFESRINEFREYKGLGSYSFTTAVKNETFLATLFSEAVEAIGDIPGCGYLPSELELSAAFLEELADALNSVQ